MWQKVGTCAIWLLKASPVMIFGTIRLYREEGNPVTYHNLAGSLEVAVCGTIFGIMLAIAFLQVTGQRD